MAFCKQSKIRTHTNKYTKTLAREAEKLGKTFGAQMSEAKEAGVPVYLVNAVLNHVLTSSDNVDVNQIVSAELAKFNDGVDDDGDS